MLFFLKTCAFLLGVGLALGFLAGPSYGAGSDKDWDAAFELTPSTSDPVSEGPQRFQDLKVTLRERMEVELDVGQNNSEENGRLLPGAARLYTDTDCTNVTQIETQDRDGNQELDEGRLCWDTDDELLYYYDTGTDADGDGIDQDMDGSWTELDYAANGDDKRTSLLFVEQSNGTSWTNSTQTLSDFEPGGSTWEISVKCPENANYEIEVWGEVFIVDTAGAGGEEIEVVLLQDLGGGGGYSQTQSYGKFVELDTSNTDVAEPVTINWALDTVTEANTHKYKVQARCIDASCSLVSNTGTAANTVAPTSQLVGKCLPQD